jgi:DNA replication protein DnaC
MKARFKLPMSMEQAYDHLLAAIMAEVAYRHRSFCTNEYLEKQLHDMASWLTSPSSHFGILLCGGCGNGKSTMLKAFQQLLNYLHIPKPYNDGTYGIQIVDAKYIAYLCKNNYESYRKLISVDMLGIDDLGTEPSEVMDYGNVYTPVIDLLTKRYEEQLFTIITTNLTPQQIRGHYGDRIADRLNEMVKKIVFNNATYRTDAFATSG